MPHYHRAASHLVKEGIAVLITDKRGVGDSTGTYVETPDMMVPAEDAVAKVKFLTGRKEIDARYIGVMGWSQGGWVGPLAATMSSKIAFVITVSGPGVAIQEQVIYQRGQELLDAGLNPKDVEEIADYRRRLWAYYGTGKGYDELQPVAETAKMKPWFSKIGSDGSSTLYKPEVLADARFQFFRNLQYDPGSALAKLKAPILAIFGDKDRLIPVKESVERLIKILSEKDHLDFTIRVFQNAGHGIQLIEGQPQKLIPGGGHSAPAQPPTPAPGYWELVTDWIKKRTSPKLNVRRAT
jgi:pimeloyl-ACP methyl ester carboxylesterase